MFNKIKLHLIDKFVYNFAPLIINFLNIKIEIINLNGELESSLNNNLVISNHISEFDTFLLYYVFSNNNASFRWVGDERLKKIPLLGEWAIYKNGIFISRIKNGCSQLKKNIKKNDKIMIFPEGTLYYKPMIKKSNEICKKNKLEKYKNVLCPKINGISTIAKIIKPKKITDITLVYHYENKNFLSGSDKPLTINNLILNPPKKISVVIRQTKLNENNSINKIFYKKDKIIEKIINDS